MSKKAHAGTSHWKVKFTRRGMEPPMPFGKTTAIVCASSRDAAKEMVPASPGYPCTASATTDKVTWPNRCHCDVKPAAQLEAKTSAQLEAEIAQVMASKSSSYAPKYGNDPGDFERGLKDGAESARDDMGAGLRETRQILTKLRNGARTEYDRGMVLAYAKALGEA